jgi:putative ATP-binding cassette transporter
MQISSAFGNVQESFSWFISAYQSLASWRATCDRLLSFRQAMTDNEQRRPAIDVQNQGSELQVHNLGLDLADGRHLLTNADMTVEPGERVMLSGRSGSGKSTCCGRWGTCGPRATALFVCRRRVICSCRRNRICRSVPCAKP